MKYLKKNSKPPENMKNLKKRSTTIHEDVRRFLGITRDAYAFCSYVHYRCADSRQKRAGWCCDNKQDVADFVGVTRPGLYKMAERLAEFGLLEISDSGDYRATLKWIDAETNCKQSLQNGQEEIVNKVYTDCKQSLHKKTKNVNKVYTDTYNIELEKNSKREEDKISPPFSHVGTIQIPETNIPLEAEKKENDFTGAGPGAEFLVTTITPQAPYIRVVEKVDVTDTPGPKTPGEKIRELCAVNHKIRETFSMVRKIPASKFDEYLTAFDAEKTGLPIPQTWKNDNDLVMNFWAWSEIRYGKEQRNAAQPQRHGNGRGAQLQNSGSDMSKYDQKQKF